MIQRARLAEQGEAGFAVEPLVEASKYPSPEPFGSGRGVITKASTKYHPAMAGWMDKVRPKGLPKVVNQK